MIALWRDPPTMNVLLEFLEFIEATRSTRVDDLLDRVLFKSRKLTGAEAGSIFIVRRAGRRRTLESMSIQNDQVDMATERFSITIDSRSIAGHVARTGKSVRLADVHRLPKNARYQFNPSIERDYRFEMRSMLCFPLKNYAGKVIGVVQLINRRDRSGRRYIPFTAAQGALIQPINHFVGGAIERTDMIERISEQNVNLAARSRTLARQRRQIAALKDQTEDAFQLSIRLLARAAELHDEDTGNHIVRVNEYSYLLAKRMELPDAYCDEIRYSAQLHDIGKMSVDQAVLKKRGALDAAERAEMNRHPDYGYKILIQSDRLTMAADIARCHHEKWDGSGYPRGLKGEAIPLSARIVQMADVYDALRAPRPYKIGFSHADARRIILEGDSRIDPGAHFDPALLRLFAQHHAEFDRIWRSLAD
jgi:HD-GYP domain-containing protein (c-di-GMP phosphodiesterase class II)